MYDQCRKKRNYEVLNELFDIILLNSIWLSSEDKQFYFPFVLKLIKDYEKLRPLFVNGVEEIIEKAR